MPPQKRLRIFFTYDATEGVLRWKHGRHSQGIKAGDPAGLLDQQSGYRVVSMFNTKYKEHRLIWVWCHGVDPIGLHVDHIDRNPLNNHIDNLRAITHQENQRNRDNWVGFRGVLMLGPERFRASITVDGKTNHIGVYDTETDAAIAYDEEALKRLGDEAQLNF